MFENVIYINYIFIIEITYLLHYDHNKGLNMEGTQLYLMSKSNIASAQLHLL